MNNQRTANLTLISQLRIKEARFRFEVEQRVRDAVAVETAALRQNLAEAIRAAKDRDGASWAAIKRAYGTTNHNTIKDLYAEAGEGALATIENPDVVFEFEPPRDGYPLMVHLTSYVNDAGDRIETDLLVAKIGDKWDAVGMFPDDVDWNKIQEAFNAKRG